MLTAPMTAVRSGGRTERITNVWRGAWSKSKKIERRTINVNNPPSCGGKGKQKSAVDEITWPQTIVLMSPIRRTRGIAMMLENDSMKNINENMAPNMAGSVLNL